MIIRLWKTCDISKKSLINPKSLWKMQITKWNRSNQIIKVGNKSLATWILPRGCLMTLRVKGELLVELFHVVLQNSSDTSCLNVIQFQRLFSMKAFSLWFIFSEAVMELMSNQKYFLCITNAQAENICGGSQLSRFFLLNWNEKPWMEIFHYCTIVM